MSAGDIYKKRLKASAASLGTGTPSESTFLRGDGAWETPVAASDVSNLENTLTMIAWDTYSADNTFDDIYIDDFTDATGIDGTVGGDTVLTGNSDGIYDSANSLFKSGALTNQTVDYTSSQIDCSAWSDVNSVAVTQTTSGDAVASVIYHAVSFDNQITYKVFKTTWQTVAYNNGGTWQYNNAGSLANASSNTLAQALIQSTDQSAYQWTKTNIEAMSDTDWNESGGWTTSVTTVDWTYRLVGGASYGSESSYAYTTMTANNLPSPQVASATSTYSTYAPWVAFQTTATANDSDWLASNNPGYTGTPESIMLDLGSGYEKIINKYRLQKDPNNAAATFPTAWKLQGTNNTSATAADAESANGWTTLDTRSSITCPANSQWTTFYTSTNTTAYRYYRLRITAIGDTSSGTWVTISRIQLVAGTVATPEFTKATINYDTDHIPLSLISNSWEASVNDPSDTYCVLDVEPVDSITLNTDLLAYASIDNGAHYEQITLEATPFREIGDHDYVRGDLSGITARTDKTIRIKVTSANSKALKLHAWAIGVKY